MIRPWVYLENVMLNATDNSYLMAVRISKHHFSALTNNAPADPVAAACLLTYAPLHAAVEDHYNALTAQDGLQKGETLNLRQLIRLEGTTKIEFWDANIRVVHPPGTARYMALFPQGRKPFQGGTQTERIAAVNALSSAIGAEPALAAVKGDVDTFFTLINNANTAQKGSITQTGTLSDDMETARVNMCIGQYSDLGAFIKAHAADTSVVNQYFDLEALRNGQQVFFTGQALTNKYKKIVKHTFGAGDHLKIENTGVTDLKFYLSDRKEGLPGVGALLMHPTDIITVLASDLGILTNPFLMAFNADLINKGKFTVEFV